MQGRMQANRIYEEPEQSAKYDSIEDRPVFAKLLSEAVKTLYPCIMLMPVYEQVSDVRDGYTYMCQRVS